MGKQILLFRDIEIAKKNYCRKTHIFLKNVDIKKVSVSNKTSFGGRNYKFFIGYLYTDHKVVPLPLCSIAYVNSYDGLTKWMHFLIEDDDFYDKRVL